MVVLAGGVGTLGGRVRVVVGGVRVGVVGASSMTMSVKGNEQGGVLKHGKEKKDDFARDFSDFFNFRHARSCC